MADLRNLADEEIMQLVQAGGPRAFELLYDRHGGAAFSLAYRMVGNRASAEDITQEAFLSIWRSRLRYDQARGSVRTWVLGIVHNRAIDGLRRSLVHDRRREAIAGMEDRFEARDRTEVERLRPAADALPRSVEQLEPPPSLKASLMKVVDSEARERSGAPARRSLWDRLLPRGRLVRPALAAGVALAVGLLAGLRVAQLGGDGESTVTAMVTGPRGQGARAELKIDDGAGTLTASGLQVPSAGGVYKVWILRPGEDAPQPNAVFLPDDRGRADVPVQGHLEEGHQGLVTPERHPQATAPPGTPSISVSVPA